VINIGTLKRDELAEINSSGTEQIIVANSWRWLWRSVLGSGLLCAVNKWAAAHGAQMLWATPQYKFRSLISLWVRCTHVGSRHAVTEQKVLIALPRSACNDPGVNVQCVSFVSYDTTPTSRLPARAAWLIARRYWQQPLKLLRHQCSCVLSCINPLEPSGNYIYQLL
jgi:hypothetical protein